MEHEPSAHIKCNGEDVEMRRDNTTLFRHLGHAAVYDHIFITLSEEPLKYTYVFQDNPGYEPLRQFLERHDYPQHINLTDAAECDKNVYVALQLQDLTQDSYPEAWDEAA